MCYNDVASKERCIDTEQKTAVLWLVLTIHCLSVATIHSKCNVCSLQPF